MEQAFRDARRWSGLTVAINLSPIQFKQAGFVAAVKRLVARTGVDPYQIEFEVTETLLLEDTDRVQRALDQLKAMGFRIALDDFGTGYSSLNYLRRFPFDKIKIDQTYIQSIETSQEAAQIIHSVVGLGRALHMTVTAEGVETGAQHRFLQAAGCHQLQGSCSRSPSTPRISNGCSRPGPGRPTGRWRRPEGGHRSSCVHSAPCNRPRRRDIPRPPNAP